MFFYNNFMPRFFYSPVNNVGYGRSGPYDIREKYGYVSTWIQSNEVINQNINTNFTGYYNFENIDKYCYKYDIDPHLVMAIIYGTKINSSSPRYGTMQLTFDQAKSVWDEIAHGVNLTPTEIELKNGIGTTEAGILYLSKLMKKYNGDINQVLQEYTGDSNYKNTVESAMMRMGGYKMGDGTYNASPTKNTLAPDLAGTTQYYNSSIGDDERHPNDAELRKIKKKMTFITNLSPVEETELIASLDELSDTAYYTKNGNIWYNGKIYNALNGINADSALESFMGDYFHNYHSNYFMMKEYLNLPDLDPNKYNKIELYSENSPRRSTERVLVYRCGGKLYTVNQHLERVKRGLCNHKKDEHEIFDLSQRWPQYVYPAPIYSDDGKNYKYDPWPKDYNKSESLNRELIDFGKNNYGYYYDEYGIPRNVEIDFLKDLKVPGHKGLAPWTDGNNNGSGGIDGSHSGDGSGGMSATPPVIDTPWEEHPEWKSPEAAINISSKEIVNSLIAKYGYRRASSIIYSNPSYSSLRDIIKDIKNPNEINKAEKTAKDEYYQALARRELEKLSAGWSDKYRDAKGEELINLLKADFENNKDKVAKDNIKKQIELVKLAEGKRSFVKDEVYSTGEYLVPISDELTSMHVDKSMNQTDYFTYFNINRIVNYNHAPEAYNHFLFFVRPDLNLDPASIEANDLLFKNSWYHNGRSNLENVSSDNLSNFSKFPLLHMENTRDFVLALTPGAPNAFIPYLTTRAKGIRIDGRALKVTEMGETYYGQTISYGNASFEHMKGKTIDIEFENDRMLSVYYTVAAWRDYIQKISQDLTWHPNPFYITQTPVLDYGGAIFYLVTKSNNIDIVFWQKFYGVFPISVPDEIFSSSKGPIFEDRFNVTFRVSAVGNPCDPNDLYSFNLINKNFEDEEFRKKIGSFFITRPEDRPKEINRSIARMYYIGDNGLITESGDYNLASTPLIINKGQVGKYGLVWFGAKVPPRERDPQAIYDPNKKNDKKEEENKDTGVNIADINEPIPDPAPSPSPDPYQLDPIISPSATPNPYIENNAAVNTNINSGAKNNFNKIDNKPNTDYAKATIKAWYSKDDHTHEIKQKMNGKINAFDKTNYLVDPDSETTTTPPEKRKIIDPFDKNVYKLETDTKATKIESSIVDSKNRNKETNARRLNNDTGFINAMKKASAITTNTAAKVKSNIVSNSKKAFGRNNSTK